MLPASNALRTRYGRLALFTLWSKTLIPTARQVPADAVVPSHQLMLRAGLIRMLGAGLYEYLPLGYRSLRKVMQIVRDEMDGAGAVEVFLPALQPIELWEQTTRRAAYGPNLFVVEDRHGRELALGPTHEEVITELARGSVESYRQLPMTLYQIQTKFRDEYRPRFGILRSREFQMKDAYSFDLNTEGLDRSYQAMYDAYCRIFETCGLPYRVVEAESGEMGGSGSQQFTVPTPTGEDTIFISDKGTYAANLERCGIGPRPHDFDGQVTGELELVHTPDCKTIQELCDFWKKSLGSKLKPQNILKTLLYTVKAHTDKSSDGPARFTCVVVVRADHDANEEKVRQEVAAIHSAQIELSMTSEQEAAEMKLPLGFVGPHVLKQMDVDSTCLLIDPDAAQDGFWVAGANKTDHHVRHFNWRRDLDPDQHPSIRVADVRNARNGDPAPDDGVLRASQGIEVGQVFKLGMKYSRALQFEVLDEQNQRQPVIMGCYGIGINRILAAAIEHDGGHDENGIIWPAPIAPYAVIITPIKYEGQARIVADRLAGEIEQRGLDVLLDDRDERPGVKFKDADLVGIPLRITIGQKALKDQQVEFKPRTAANAQRVDIDQAADRAAELLCS